MKETLKQKNLTLTLRIKLSLYSLMNNRMFNDKLKSHSLYHRKYKYDSFYLKFFANQRKILETK